MIVYQRKASSHIFCKDEFTEDRTEDLWEFNLVFSPIDKIIKLMSFLYLLNV